MLPDGVKLKVKTVTRVFLLDNNEEEEGDGWLRGVLQVREAKAYWRKLVSLWSITRSVIGRTTWAAEWETMRCVLETSRVEQTAARYVNHHDITDTEGADQTSWV